jgi:alpha-methylacyl-CoA racemase
MMAGPLDGVLVVEIGGIGPGPFAAMLLGDMGAEVIRVDRPSATRGNRPRNLDVMLRNRRSIAIDMKCAQGRDTVLSLVPAADVLIEGFRPGVMERLGLGPEACLERNPRLVYGRMTGWGQDGPYSAAAGHDINYIALAGVLAYCAREGQAPVPPLNLVADFGGGGMLLALGIVCALLERGRSGAGQVIDAAMVDGSALMMTLFWGMRDMGLFDDSRPGTNLIDTGAPFYDVYQCKDGSYISVGSIEPQFYRMLLQHLELDRDPSFAARQMDRTNWPVLKKSIAARFRTKTRDEWCGILEGTDVCFAPVLTMTEAAEHPHNVARGTFVAAHGQRQPNAAPRFSRTRPELRRPAPRPGEHSRAILAELGMGDEQVDALLAAGAVVQG